MDKIKSTIDNGSQSKGYCKNTSADLFHHSSNAALCANGSRTDVCMKYTWHATPLSPAVFLSRAPYRARLVQFFCVTHVRF